MAVRLGGKLPKKRSSQRLQQDFPMSLDDVFNFGKYKDTNTTLKQAIQGDIEYIDYCIEGVDEFEIDNEAYTLYIRLGGKM